MIEKKPSVFLIVSSCELMPSTVMLIEPRGKPLMLELRFVLAVSTPASVVMKFIASRLTSGSEFT